MSVPSSPLGDSSKINLIAALGTGATAAVVLYLFISYSKDQGARQDSVAAETRKQLLDSQRDNRDKLTDLIGRQTEAMRANAAALERLSRAIERDDRSIRDARAKP